jgi:hypothetical protein
MPGFRCTPALVGGLLVLLCLGIARASGSPPKVEMIDLDPALRISVVVSQRVWAKERKRGLGRLLPSSGALVIRPATYPISLALRSSGHEWLLVPYKLRSDGLERSPDTSMSVVSGCSSRFRRFLALDRASRKFEPRVWRVHYHHCTDGLAEPSVEGEWSSEIQVQEQGRVEVRGFGTAEAAIAADRAEAARAHVSELTRLRDEQAKAPLKQQIGARLCKTHGAWEFIGFTEAVSPDNGKIKIRIVDQLRVGTTNVRAGGFLRALVRLGVLEESPARVRIEGKEEVLYAQSLWSAVDIALNFKRFAGTLVAPLDERAVTTVVVEGHPVSGAPHDFVEE